MGPSSGALPWQAASSSSRLIKLFWRGCGGWITEQLAVGCDGCQPPSPHQVPCSSGNANEPGASLSALGHERQAAGCLGLGTCSCQAEACCPILHPAAHPSWSGRGPS